MNLMDPGPVKNSLCPHINDPFSDCHISSLDSRNIEDAIYYCGGHYEECGIYKKHMLQFGGQTSNAR